MNHIPSQAHALWPSDWDTSGQRVWECSCGWVTVETKDAPAYHTPIANRIYDHLVEQAGIHWRTAGADFTAGCGCPDDVPANHSHELFLRRRISDGTPNQVVIWAYWMGGFKEIYAWCWNAAGLAVAQAFCDLHPTTWKHNHFQVLPGDLAVHANAI